MKNWIFDSFCIQAPQDQPVYLKPLLYQFTPHPWAPPSMVRVKYTEGFMPEKYPTPPKNSKKLNFWWCWVFSWHESLCVFHSDHASRHPWVWDVFGWHFGQIHRLILGCLYAKTVKKLSNFRFLTFICPVRSKTSLCI